MADDARLGISARGFCTKHRIVLLMQGFLTQTLRDMKTIVFNNATCERKEEKRHDIVRVLQVENKSFTPLIFSVNRSMRRKANKFYGSINEILADKRNKAYSVKIVRLRRKVLLP